MAIPDELSATNAAAPIVAASTQLVRRLIAAEGVEPRDAGMALQRTCLRFTDRLRDSLGDEGCTALFARALKRTEAAHPSLKELRRTTDGAIYLEGVAASVEVHGLAAVTAAVEALLAAAVDVLTRLIGEDMAIRIIDADAPSRHNGTTP